IVSDRDVDVSPPHRNGIAAQAVAPIGSAPAACQVVLPTVPRTHEMRLGFVEPLTAYRAVGVEHLLVAPDDLAGANRSSLVHAAILVSDQPALDSEQAHFHVACYSQHAPVFGNLAERHDTVLDGTRRSDHRLHKDVRGEGLEAPFPYLFVEAPPACERQRVCEGLLRVRLEDEQ